MDTMRKQGSWEVGDVVKTSQSISTKCVSKVYAYYILWLRQTYSLLRGGGAFVHLGRGHSAVMFTSRTQIQNCTTIWLQLFWFYSLSTLYTATTHMIIAWNYRVPRVIRQWTLRDAVLFQCFIYSRV